MNAKRSLLCLCAFLILTVASAKAQSPASKDSSTAAAIKQLLEKHTFRFFIQSVVPPGGQTTSVPGENYTFRVQGDSLRVNIPYYGRSSQAYADSQGFTFSWVNFEYKLEERKKSWNITFRRKNSPDVSYMVLNVLKTGVATLYVEPRTRPSISYMGNITE